MAGLKELDSFFGKFVQLWKNGIDVNLSVNASAGKAFVNLQAGLGEALVLSKQHEERVVAGNSRHRRQLRRAAARRDAEQDASVSPTTDSEVVEEATFMNEDVQESARERESDEAEKVESEHVKETEKVEDERVETEQVTTYNEQIKDDNTDKNKESHEKQEPMNTTADATIEEREAAEKLKDAPEPKIAVPAIVTVHATAVFEDSPNKLVTQDEIDSMVRFITNRDHLARNVSDVRYLVSSSRELHDQKFRHNVQVEINVRTANLWEGARQYIWKHLGGDTWSRGNGTRISLVRIHQKFS